MELIFTPQEIIILKDICEIQISSFYNILKGNILNEDEELLMQFQASLGIAKREAKWKISQYTEVIQHPICLASLEESDISTMRHILFHMEEEYIIKYPHAVKQLWGKFFEIEEFRNPQLQLLTNTIKSNKNEKEQKHHLAKARV